MFIGCFLCKDRENRGQGTHRRKRSLADLYQRLKKYTPHIPPLRECKDDILPLADFFLQLANEEFEKQTKGFDAETIAHIHISARNRPRISQA